MTTTKKQQNTMKATDEWFVREEKRINRIIGNFRASYMSNTKWRKILTLLAGSSYLINSPYFNNRYRWKFVNSEKIFETPIIRINELDEKGLKDFGHLLIYKEVEWLEVVTENSKEITDELQKHGQFALDRTDKGFKVIGYAL